MGTEPFIRIPKQLQIVTKPQCTFHLQQCIVELSTTDKGEIMTEQEREILELHKEAAQLAQELSRFRK